MDTSMGKGYKKAKNNVYCRTGNFHGHVIFVVFVKINHRDLDRVKKKSGKTAKKNRSVTAVFQHSIGGLSID